VIDKNKLSRRERESLRHREEILEGAKRVFFTNGYSSTTMEMIAVEAEFSLATVYKFFGSKENLFVEILLQVLERMERQLDEISSREIPVKDRIIEYFDSRMDHFWKNPAMIGLIEEVLRNKSSALACLDDLKNRYVTFINRLALLFSEGMTRGEFKEKDDGIMAVAFEGMLHMYFGHLNQIKATERNRKDEADLLSIFMDGAAVKPNPKTAE
jgi:AcrR family transcriptional regulator